MSDVAAGIHACRSCAAVQPGPILPTVPADLTPRIMLVGEAPGRLGAGKSGVPFRGDEAGRRLDVFLSEAGLDRAQVYVTNAVLCLPLDAHGNNRTPSAVEVRRCAVNLATQLGWIRPRVVVTLGGVALKAADLIMPHGLQLTRAVGVPERWHDRWLVPMFHPARRSTVHRGDDVQRADWDRLGRWLNESCLVPDSAPR